MIGDAAQIWMFANAGSVGTQIARWIVGERNARDLQPRDFAILVRQKTDVYEGLLSPCLAKQGLRLRNEAKQVGRTTLQELLADDAARAASSVVRLAVQARAPGAWQVARQMMFVLRDAVGRDDAEARRVEDELANFVRKLGARLKTERPSTVTAGAVAHDVWAFMDPAAMRRAFPQYAQGDDLAIFSDAFAQCFADSALQAESWLKVVDSFDGVDQVPLMTVHKSKGLEYDTVIFVGLDDDAWWAHRPGDMDGLSTFFVALSRAKERAIFTYSGGGRDKVRDLYGLLKGAGVREVRY